MIAIVVLSLAGLGQDNLPGSALGLSQAVREACLIAVVEVGRTGDLLDGGTTSALTWTELKPSAMLKGRVTAKELNTLPLAVLASKGERLPKSGEVLIAFFTEGSEGSPRVSKLVPRTEANVAAIEALRDPPSSKSTRDPAPCPLERPLTRVGVPMDGLKARPVPRYLGTEVLVDPDAGDDVLEAQAGFAAAMSRADPDPRERRDHFAWLEANETARRYGVRRVGWQGKITEVRPHPKGSWLVRVAIQPRLDAPTLRTYLLDKVEETYEYAGDRLRLVRSDATIARPGLRRFPVFW